MQIPVRLISTVFSRVFQESKETSRKVAPQLIEVGQSVSRIGTKRLKEFLFALPIFISFFLALLRQRDQIHARGKLYIIGAAASLSTLGLIALGSLLSSLPVQIGILLTHPWIGIPLLFSEGIVITAIMVLLVWLIIYAINSVMADDHVYQSIRKQYIPLSTESLLAEIQAEIESGGADLDALRVVVEKGLKARGSTADTDKLEKSLRRLEKRFTKKSAKRLSDAAKSSKGY